MLQKILSGYKKLCGGLVKILILLGICVGFGFLLVYPLWYFATTNPGAYTVVVFCVFLLALIGFIANKIFASLKGASAEERRKKLVSLALGAAKALIVILGVGAVCAFVLHGMRLVALFAIAVAVALYGICAFGAKGN